VMDNGTEREEPSGALLASDREAHPYPLQEVPDASAPPETYLKRVLGPLCPDQRTLHIE
jgi:hypothetical protein